MILTFLQLYLSNMITLLLHFLLFYLAVNGKKEDWGKHRFFLRKLGGKWKLDCCPNFTLIYQFSSWGYCCGYYLNISLSVVADFNDALFSLYHCCIVTEVFVSGGVWYLNFVFWILQFPAYIYFCLCNIFFFYESNWIF